MFCFGKPVPTFPEHALIVTVAPLLLVKDRNHVCFDHVGHQGIKAYLVPPAELGARLAGVAEQRINLGGAEIAWIDLDERLAGRLVDALLVDAVPTPFHLAADMAECLLDELAH